MNQVIARIDITTPTGRRLLKELEKHKKSVKVEYPLPEAIADQQTYTHEEIFSDLRKRIKKHFGEK